MPGDAPSYVIVGDGRWAQVIRNVLVGQGRRSSTVRETRRRVAESDRGFKSRISESLLAAGAQIAWLCVPPCADLPLIVESAISTRLHVIAEKPWLCPPVTTDTLVELAGSNKVLTAVHFQYCFLDEVESLRRRTHDGGAKARFSGVFTISRPDRIGIPALENLGSHLLAVREYAVPNSELLELRCSYESTDQRWVRLEEPTSSVNPISLQTEEPTIQRFLTKFENAIPQLAFPLDLRFAARVGSALSAYRVCR